MSRIFLLSIALLFLLSSCKKKVYDHFVIEITYPDQSKEMVSLCQDNQLLITLGEKHYILQSKAVREESADVEMVEAQCLSDSMRMEFNIIKSDSKQEHFVLHQPHELGSNKSGIMIELVQTLELEPGAIDKQCYSKAGCCMTTCYSTLCCIAGAECEALNCSCEKPVECGIAQSLPNIRQFAKLFSREKINVHVPFP